LPELRRLSGHRFVGVRDTMLVYDTDDVDQRSSLMERLAADDLVGQKLIQTFGPDTLPEARNRGFRAQSEGLA
jgi:hypothetical protein